MGHTGTEIDVTGDRDAWLAERRSGIGASEAAAALGLSPFETPLELYLRKIGELPDAEETEAMRWGSRLEPLIAEAYEEATGHRVVREQQFRRADGRPHLFATVDAVGSAGLVEFKTLSAFKSGSLGEEGTDDLPEHWLVQAHQQMAVFGEDHVHFAVLVGGQRFRTFHVDRNDLVVEALLTGVDTFWSMVQSRVPPPATAWDAGMLSALRPEEGKAIAIHAPDVLDAADRYAEIGRRIRELQEDRDGARARLLEAMGDAAIATLPDGRELARKVVSRKGYTVEAKEYVDFRIKTAKGG